MSTLCRLSAFVVALAVSVNVASAGEKVTPDQAKKLIEAMDKAHLTLSMAITKAESESKGHAIGGWGMMDHDTFVVEVPVYAHDKLMNAHVGTTGEVTDTKPADKNPDAAKAGDIVKAFESAKFNWNTLVSDAEKHSHGKAFKASAKLNGTELEVWVACLVGEEISYCKIDSHGKVTTETPKHDTPKIKP